MNIWWLVGLGGLFLLSKKDKEARLRAHRKAHDAMIKSRWAQLTTAEREEVKLKFKAELERKAEALTKAVSEKLGGTKGVVPPSDRVNLVPYVESVINDNRVKELFPEKLREKIYLTVMSKQYARGGPLTFKEIYDITLAEWNDHAKRWEGTELIGIPGMPMPWDLRL